MPTHLQDCSPFWRHSPPAASHLPPKPGQRLRTHPTYVVGVRGSCFFSFFGRRAWLRGSPESGLAFSLWAVLRIDCGFSLDRPCTSREGGAGLAVRDDVTRTPALPGWSSGVLPQAQVTGCGSGGPPALILEAGSGHRDFEDGV